MNILQIRASNPSTSAWVSASAGTGKTKILTDRVLRLLIAGVRPEKILCLTFTNAAAGEMQERIRQKLESLSAASSDELLTIISEITGTSPTSEELQTAKKLYKNYLSSEQQINIHTLHSYCQKILQQFPLEAGVAPSFRILDETAQIDAIQNIKRSLLADPDYESLSIFLAENFHQLTIDELFKDILTDRMKFTKETDASYEILNQVQDDTWSAQDDTWGAQDDTSGRNNYISNLIEAFKNPCTKKYDQLLSYPLILNQVDVNATPAKLKKFFLNKDGSPKKRIVSAKVAKVGSALHDELLIIQERVYLLDQEDRQLNAERYTAILKHLARDFIARYDEHKKQGGFLDYDDLILKTRALLCDKEARSWVLYKLDGGIDHLLVDEAQDTSPDQWLIIDALIQEFYAGISDKSETDRTIFVVGDEKQSIFSFQGADIESFVRMNKLLAEKLKGAESNFEDIKLDVSYRSAPEILEVVYSLFKSLPEGSFARAGDIAAHRSDHKGRVELWPIEEETAEEDEFWPVAKNASLDAQGSAKTRLAKQVANFIKQECDSGKYLAATGEQITPGDFMVLFRTRSELTDLVIKELKQAEVPVSGLDRVVLSDELIVQDLLAMAKFACTPEDDLNLACLLKSPFIDMGEEEMYEKIRAAGESPLYQTLNIKLLNIIQKLYRSYSIYNFFLELTNMLDVRAFIPRYYDPSAPQSLDEFLRTAENYTANYDSSLQGFLTWFSRSEMEIKKEVESGNQVRIMTVHGSKGLQSPYVIMCDTTSLPTNKDRFIWCEERGAVSVPTSSYAPDFYHDLKEEAKNKEYREYLRLLYVGMTRAEDQLIVAGYKGKKELPENCWYNLVRNIMQQIGSEEEGQLVLGSGEGLGCVESPNHVIAGSGLSYNVKVLSHPESPSSCHPELVSGSKTTNEILKQAQDDIGVTRDDTGAKTPLLSKETFVLSPLTENPSLEYGLVFHKVLEDSVRLGSLSEMKWHPLIETLQSKESARIHASIEKILQNKGFISLLAHKTNTELSIGNADEVGNKIGRIDLLVDDGTNLHIIDYKSDSMPAKSKKDIPAWYITQLEFYRSTLAVIYPDRQIKCYILWLENGALTECLSNLEESTNQKNPQLQLL